MANYDIYEYLEHGGNVQEDLAGMNIGQMEDYFGDLDPCAFL